jgi:1-acyl-sn-glycerol-3-phosphate acyltransferase
MSPNKPKRPSARPASRRSSAPPPPASDRQLEIPAPPPLPEATGAPSGANPARIDKKKLRVSARRGPATAGSVERPQPAPAARVAAPAGKARKPAANTPPAAPKPAADKAPPAVKVGPVPSATSADRPAPGRAEPGPSTNGASKHPEAQAAAQAAEPVSEAASGAAVPAEAVAPEAARVPFAAARARPDSDEPGDYADDDIWNEADTGPSVHLYAARLDEVPAASPSPAPHEAAASADPEAAPAPLSRLARSRRDGARDEAVRLGSAQTLVSTDYYFRQYGAHGMRSLSAEVDEFGLDPHVEQRARPWLEGLCKRYFRVDVDGVQNLPADGRVLMVCNRAGALPWDGLVLRTTVRMARPELQPVRWLAEDSVFHYPFLGVFMNRLGAVRACPENAERLLKKDRLVAVFPEGAHGSGKLFKDRYRLQRFGRGGYVKLALKLGAPIVPTAIIGSEETNPVLARSRLLGRILGAETAPITPTFPWLGLAGAMPAPIKWRIVVGEPIDLSSYGPKSADEALLVHRLNEQIRGILQQLVDQALGARRSVLFG